MEGNTEGKLKMLKYNLSELEKAYIAGFLDGDGSIIIQIVRDNTHKFGFYIRISLVFYQNTKHHWFIEYVGGLFKPFGFISKRKSGMSEFTITERSAVKFILTELYPYLKIKKPVSKLALEIIKDLELVQTETDFIKVCQKVDKVVEYTDSKTRKISTEIVALHLRLPVETSILSKIKN